MPKENKIDKIELDKRIRIVQEWIIDDWHYGDIVTNIMTKWNISIAQAKRYIQKARDRWSEKEQDAVDQKRRRKIESLKKLKRSLDHRHKGTPLGIRAVLAVEKEIISLENLRPPTKIQLSPDPDNPTPFPVEIKHDLSKLSTEELEMIVSLSKKAVKNDD